jgi:hypothetical protein
MFNLTTEKKKKRNELIKEISTIKHLSLEVAERLLSTLEIYCELIINYTILSNDE